MKMTIGAGMAGRIIYRTVNIHNAVYQTIVYQSFQNAVDRYTIACSGKRLLYVGLRQSNRRATDQFKNMGTRLGITDRFHYKNKCNIVALL